MLYLFIGIGAIIVIAPLIWMFLASVKSLREITTVPLVFLPEKWMWSNYLSVLEILPFSRFFLNSIVVAVSVTVGVIFTSSLAGYTFAKLRFPGRDLIFIFILSTIMIPFFVVSIPLYVMMRWFGWLNSYLALIIPFLVSTIGIFLVRQFTLSIPDELLDAARIDGYGTLGVWWRVVAPLTKPALAAVAIFTFVFIWDQLLWPLLATQKVEMYTLPLGINLLQTREQKLYHLQMAGSMIAAIPTIIVFILAQKHIVKGISLTGLKY